MPPRCVPGAEEAPLGSRARERLPAREAAREACGASARARCGSSKCSGVTMRGSVADVWRFRLVHLAMACRARACSARIVRPVPNAIVGHDSVTSNPVRTDHTATAAHPSTLMQKRTPITPAGGRRRRSGTVNLPLHRRGYFWSVRIETCSATGTCGCCRDHRAVPSSTSSFESWLERFSRRYRSRASDTRIVVPTRNAVVRHQAVASNPVPIAHMPTAVHPSTLQAQITNPPEGHR